MSCHRCVVKSATFSVGFRARPPLNSMAAALFSSMMDILEAPHRHVSALWILQTGASSSQAQFRIKVVQKAYIEYWKVYELCALLETSVRISLDTHDNRRSS